jgi:hypothetical protein
MKNKSNSFELNAEEKQMITNEIMDLSTNWINSSQDLDAGKAVEFWDPSPDLMFAENGAFFPNRDSIYDYLNNTMPTLKSLDANWGKRVIIPLSYNSASMAGQFHFKMSFKTGEVVEGNSMFTGVFIKKENTWRLVHGHESFKE